MGLSSLFIAVAVVGANVLGVAMLLPQMLRMVRGRDTAGVSGIWIGAGIGINAGWLMYALPLGLWALVPVAGGALALYGRMAVLTRTLAPELFRNVVPTAVALCGAFVVAGLVAGSPGVGAVVAALYAAQFAPATWTALTATDTSGISIFTWVMALLEAAIWSAYGGHIGDAALTFGAFGAAMMSLGVIVGALKGTIGRNVEPRYEVVVLRRSQRDSD